MRGIFLYGILLAACLTVSSARQLDAAETPAAPRRVKILFLGDNDHHQPAQRIAQMLVPFAERGIDLTYTDDLNDLNPKTLNHYDGLLVYANHTKISPEQEKALMDFVALGKGLIAVHCASYCFHNSPAYTQLVGAQFKSHGTGVFKTKITQPDHPVMSGVENFESWDETYIHDKHNADRVVLEERVEGGKAEPWTWVRTHGKGRVFYTAWGHDQRTWSNPGFVRLLEQGTRWAVGDWALAGPSKLKLFEYVEANVPNYVPSGKWGEMGEAIRKMQKPLSPADSMEHLVVPAEFRVELFVAEPDVVKPIAMAWDERGRLWVAETVDYPNDLQPKGAGHDRIKICEDTDGDGRADKFTIFAENLSIPTSLVHANVGLIVSAAPDMLFLKDTDGDDKADVRRVLFTGFGTNDTHAGPSNLRYGFDNWVWATVGYSGFNGEVGGKKLRFGQGVFRFKPDGSAMEFIGSTSNNTWGLGWSETGEVFASTANNDHGDYVAIPNRYYESVRGWHGSGIASIVDHRKFHPITGKVRQMDWHGAFTAAAGHTLYTARAFPKKYWNRIAFITEPTGHLVHQTIIEPVGSHFVARDGFNLFAGDDEWVAPVAADVGPDGAVWVLDWYNYIIQHNPTPPGFETGKGNAYVTPLRDKTHARIYRVVYKEAGEPKVKSLDNNDPEHLVQALFSDNLFWRLTAQRLMVERGNLDVVPQLFSLTRGVQLDQIGSSPWMIHALWTLHGLGAIRTEASLEKTGVIQALVHPAPAARIAALRVLPRDAESAKALLDANLLEDKNPFVRRDALLALAEMVPSKEAGPRILAMLRKKENTEDRWIPDAAVAAAAKHDASFMAAVLAAAQPIQGTPKSDPVNLLSNISFETIQGDRVLGWTGRNWQGEAKFSAADSGRSGQRSVSITSTSGADSSWSLVVPVKPATQYRLTGWIKTKGLNKGTGLGALLNVHELQSTQPVRTEAVTDTRDWTRVEVAFSSGSQTQLTINCLFGGWGKSTGTAFYDDLELIEVGSASTGLGPAVDQAVKVVTTHYAYRAPGESVVELVQSFAGADESLVASLLDGLLAGWPKDKPVKLTGGDLPRMREALSSLPVKLQPRLLQLLTVWGMREEFADQASAVVQKLRAQITGASNPVAVRTEAARWLLRLDDKPAVVLEPITPGSPRDLVEGLLGSLTESRDESAAELLLEKYWPMLTPSSRQVALGVLLRRPTWTLKLLETIQAGTVLPVDLSPQQWSQLAASGDTRIKSLVKELQGRAANPDMEKLVEKFMPVAKLKGDAAKGKDLYTVNCFVCHEFNGTGGKVGPALTGIGVRPREELIVAIIDPNRSVEANFRLWVVETKDGQVFSGRMDVESQTALEIMDLVGQKHVVQRADIKSLTAAPVSLMPPGFERLGEQGIADLLEYLAHHD